MNFLYNLLKIFEKSLEDDIKLIKPKSINNIIT